MTSQTTPTVAGTATVAGFTAGCSAAGKRLNVYQVDEPLRVYEDLATDLLLRATRLANALWNEEHGED